MGRLMSFAGLRVGRLVSFEQITRGMVGFVEGGLRVNGYLVCVEKYYGDW